MRTSSYDYCAERNELSLLTQWHPVKNGPLMPWDVVAGNSRKVWWLCAKGHAWQTKICSRTSGGVGCPVYAGKNPPEAAGTLPADAGGDGSETGPANSRPPKKDSRRKKR